MSVTPSSHVQFDIVYLCVDSANTGKPSKLAHKQAILDKVSFHNDTPFAKPIVFNSIY